MAASRRRRVVGDRGDCCSPWRCPASPFDVARAAYKLFAARPFSLSTVGFMVVAVGVASWTAAAVALRRD